MQRRDDLEIEIVAPDVVVGLGDRRAGAATRVVDDAVESVEATQRGGEELVQLRRVGDVGLEAQGVAAQALLRLAQPVVVAAAYRHAGSLARRDVPRGRGQDRRCRR